MGYTIKLKIDKTDLRQDGSGALFFQVIINRKKKRFGLDLAWPPNKFVDDQGCLPRFRGDTLADDYNLIISKERARASDIFVVYRLREKPLDIYVFEKEYKSKLSKDDFIAYMAEKSKERLTKNVISALTYDQEQSTINKLKEFSDVIPFSLFHATWGYEYNAFLSKEKNNGQNTLWSEAKRIKTYLTLAKEDGIEFIDPYARVSIRQVEGRFEALDKDQFKQLWDYYNSASIPPVHKVILRGFLFSCCTGLRIGDLRELNRDNFKDDKMSLTPEKTERYGTKINKAPLNAMAIIMLRDEMNNSGYQLFNKYSEGYGNLMLKQICKDINIDHEVHYHIARSTFASLYDQAGGNTRTLMKFMGIRQLKTVMRYIQTNKKVMADDIKKLNESLA
jgi:integrase